MHWLFALSLFIPSFLLLLFCLFVLFSFLGDTRVTIQSIVNVGDEGIDSVDRTTVVQHQN